MRGLLCCQCEKCLAKGSFGGLANPMKAKLRALEMACSVNLIVTSAARCEAHNTAVGGKPGSHHIVTEARPVAYAADFFPVDVDATKPQHMKWSRRKYEFLEIVKTYFVSEKGYCYLGIGQQSWFIHAQLPLPEEGGEK